MLIQLYPFNSRKYSGFAFNSTGRKCSAAQLPPFIRHIIVPEMHQSTCFA